MFGLANQCSGHLQLRETPGVELVRRAASARLLSFSYAARLQDLFRDCSSSICVCLKTVRCSSLDRKFVVLYLELAVVLGDP